MEDDWKRQIDEPLIKIQEIIIPEMLSTIDVNINNQIKIIENMLITIWGSSDRDSAAREAIDVFKKILDSNFQSIYNLIEIEVKHMFLVFSKELKKMTAFIIQAENLKIDPPSPIINQLQILLNYLGNFFSQSIEQALKPVMKDFLSIERQLRNTISSTTDSPTFLAIIQGLTNQQQKKIDSLQY